MSQDSKSSEQGTKKEGLAALADVLPQEPVATPAPESADETPFVEQEPHTETPIVYTQKLDDHGRAYATGKRKDAVARIWIRPGSGKITINKREFENYFPRAVLRMLINQPMECTERGGQYDIMGTVSGGGLSGQAGAVRHGISRALVHFEPALRPVLKRGGFLTRDSRTVERKKYGHRKARRSFQFSKR